MKLKWPPLAPSLVPITLPWSSFRFRIFSHLAWLVMMHLPHMHTGVRLFCHQGVLGLCILKKIVNRQASLFYCRGIAFFFFFSLVPLCRTVWHQEKCNTYGPEWISALWLLNLVYNKCSSSVITNVLCEILFPCCSLAAVENCNWLMGNIFKCLLLEICLSTQKWYFSLQCDLMGWVVGWLLASFGL